MVYSAPVYKSIRNYNEAKVVPVPADEVVHVYVSEQGGTDSDIDLDSSVHVTKVGPVGAHELVREDADTEFDLDSSERDAGDRDEDLSESEAESEDEVDDEDEANIFAGVHQAAEQFNDALDSDADAAADAENEAELNHTARFLRNIYTLNYLTCPYGYRYIFRRGRGVCLTGSF